MKKLILTLFIIFLTTTSGLNVVSAENETLASTDNENEKENQLKIKSENSHDSEIVSANEGGNFNISFNNGYNGYCIDYGDHEAQEGQNFTVQDTSYAINHENGQSVGNELKTFFVDYYDIAMKDKIVTQHVIWHFTNNFSGWRVDPDLINEIREKSSQKIIPDNGAVRKINNTTEAVFSFEVLDAHEEGHQNFFAYKVIYRNIGEIIENVTGNSTAPLKNDTENDTIKENKSESENETVSVKENGTGNIVSPKNNDTVIESTDKSNDDESGIKQDLNRHVTGYNYIPAIIILLIGTLLLIKYTRD